MRKCTICLDLESAAEQGKRFIGIRDVSHNYDTNFYLEDGKNLTVIRPDGTSSTQKCQYIDPYHFYFGSSCYHVDQFAELVHKNGLRCKPSEYVTDWNLYEKMYADRAVTGPDGKPIAYRKILAKSERNLNTQVVAVCPDVQIGRQVCIWNNHGPEGPRKDFYSAREVMTDLLPALKLSEHKQALLEKILTEMDRQIPRITQQEFDAIGKDYKGIYGNFDGKHPEWAGKRTAFLPGHGTTLFIEDVSFIIEPRRKLALSAQVKAAATVCEESCKSSEKHRGPEPDR